MKRVVGAIVLLAVLAMPTLAGAQEFKKGAFYLTPQIGVNSYTIPFGVNAEFALTENIGVGGTAMVWLWSDEWFSQSLIALQAEALYHFTGLKVQKLDLFAGAGLGYSIYSWSWKDIEFPGVDTGGSGLYLNLILGGRYWFSPKLAVSLRLNGGFLGDWGGIGGQLGVTLRLK